MKRLICSLMALSFGFLHATDQAEHVAQNIRIETADAAKFVISYAAAMQSITLEHLLEFGEVYEIITLPITRDAWSLVVPLLEAAAYLPDAQKINSLAQMLPAHSPEQLVQIANTSDYLNFQAGLTAVIRVILNNEIQQNNRDPLKIIHALCAPKGPYRRLHPGVMNSILELFFATFYKELFPYQYQRAYKLLATLNRSTDGHTDGVRALAISPDGTKLYSAAEDKTIKVWDITQDIPRLITTLDESVGGHTNWVCALAITPDGKKLFSGSLDATIKIWDLTQSIPQLITTLDDATDGHANWVNALAISPDGTELFSGSVDKSVKVWDITQRFPRLITTLDKSRGGHESSVQALAISPDGIKLFSGSDDKAIKVWDLTQVIPGLITTLDQSNGGHTWSINSLTVSPDGTKLFSGSQDTTIKVWDIRRSAIPRLITTLDESMSGHTVFGVHSLAMSSDGSKLFSGSWDWNIKIWDFTHDAPLLITTLDESNDGHLHMVHTFAISPDGTKLFSGSLDETIKVWNLPLNRNDLRYLSIQQAELIVRLCQMKRGRPHKRKRAGQKALNSQEQVIFASLPKSIQDYFSEIVSIS